MSYIIYDPAGEAPGRILSRFSSIPTSAQNPTASLPSNCIDVGSWDFVIDDYYVDVSAAQPYTAAAIKPRPVPYVTDYTYYDSSARDSPSFAANQPREKSYTVPLPYSDCMVYLNGSSQYVTGNTITITLYERNAFHAHVQGVSMLKGILRTYKWPYKSTSFVISISASGFYPYEGGG